MVADIADCAILNNGVKMPWLGLGTWQLTRGREAADAVAWALEAGYRHIDTAPKYENEEIVALGIAESGVKREDLFITSKVWNSAQGFEPALKAFDGSLRRMKLDYFDLYLVHWPVKGKYTQTWKALEKLYREGAVRAIGLSNFQIHHVEDILRCADIAPAVDQVEYQPFLAQPDLKEFCKKRHIQMEASSPLMMGRLWHPVIAAVGAKYGKTPAQAVLRWDIQGEVVTIPKSGNERRIRENADIFDFVLSDADMAAIDALNENRRFGADPDNFDF